jgi:hypothetical protein
VPLALRLRASCPSQRSVPPPCRPGVAKQVRLGRRRSPGGSLRVAWVVRVSSQAAHNVARSPPDQTPIHASAGKRSSAKCTRSPSNLSQPILKLTPHTGPFRGSAIVPTQSPSFFPELLIGAYTPVYTNTEAALFTGVRGSEILGTSPTTRPPGNYSLHASAALNCYLGHTMLYGGAWERRSYRGMASGRNVPREL